MTGPQPAEIRRAIMAMGSGMGPQVVAACRDLFAAEQQGLAEKIAPVALDCAYGDDARHRLDLYRDSEHEGLPVLLFVHGGGFLMGDKGGEGSQSGWSSAHIGRWAAANGMLGAVMNYRLAPDHQWPAGAQDVGAAVAWLRENAAQHGGDPARIVVMGTSAGAVHVAGFLRDDPHHADLVKAAILLSGLYGFTPLDDRDERYYGPQADYASRMPLGAVVATGLPLYLAGAQYDPPRFQREWAGLMQARLERHGTLPRGYLASGHTHYTLPMHLGTSDTRLSDELLTFLSDTL
ncbi:alpha/beta hydrolase [Novosphingobium sp. 9]|uniref:alpha/beta hydrolase n=1 Tax=Novosphingobium sp. 9 TaxID=2025349 RepID=UPI0021B6158D|nr:alpha/beta hydrolase [Novosphingobium sp. 9]